MNKYTRSRARTAGFRAAHEAMHSQPCGILASDRMLRVYHNGESLELTGAIHAAIDATLAAVEPKTMKQYFVALLNSEDVEEETSTISEAGSPWPSGPYKPEAHDAKETPEEKPRLLGTFMGYQIYTDPRMDDETLRIMKRRLTLEVRPPGYEKKS